MRIELLPDDQLAARRDRAEATGDRPAFERCEAEMERRDDDAADPASPQNTRQDTPALDPPWWEYR
jgi:hypothetical protein